MTPLSIELEGIRSFTTSRTIDFAGLELFAIIGDTGSGKSSILEAMIYALFNATSWDGRNVKELLSTGATRMRVRFRFSLGERTYTVTRVTPREGAAVHVLECDGLVDERRDGDRAVSARLAELLGVDRDQFIKTVVLPQGEFAALLTLKPGERAKLLTDVLGLGIIDDMAQKASIVKARSRSLLDKLKGKRSALPDDPSGALREATDLAKVRKRRESTLQRALDEIGVEADALAVLEERRVRRGALEATIAVIAPEVTALRNLREIDAELRQQIDEAEAERTKAKARLEAAAAEVARAKAEGRDVDTIAGLRQTLVRLAGEWRERARETTEFGTRAGEAASTKATLAQHSAALAAAGAASETAALAADVAKIEAEAALGKSTAAEKAWNAFAHAAVASREASGEHIAATARLAETIEELARAKQREDDTEKNLSGARQRLSDAERENAAAHAAHGLTAKDACPVCLRALPPGFRPPVAADLERAKRQAKDAENEHRVASVASTRAEEQNKFAQAVFENWETKLRLCVATLETMRVDAMAAGIDVAGDADEALTEVRERARLAEDRRAEASEALTLATREFSRAEMFLEATRERLNELEADLARRAEGIASRSREIDLLRAQIPRAYLKASAELSETLLASADERLRAAAETARDLAAAHIEALHGERDASERATALRERRRVDIDRPVAAARVRLLSASDALSAGGYAMPAEADVEGDGAGGGANRRPLAGVLAWANALETASANAATLLANEDAEDASASAGANARIADRLARSEVASVAELRAKREEALVALGVATSLRDGLIQAVAQAAALDAQIANVEPIARALDVLYLLLSGVKFKKFVTERKQDKLLGVATSILGRMTNERYGFGADMSIVDRSASQARSAETLSGGEKFLASLALALALVEIARRSGRHFGALFLDEGFGSLDPQALDEALAELERQAKTGRMIGVITHVTSVRDYIDDVLGVVRTPSGSEVYRGGGGDDEIEAMAQAAPGPATPAA